MDRIQKLAGALPSGSDAFVITSTIDRRYLTGFLSSAGTLVVLAQTAYLLVDSRYIDAARERAQDCTVLLAVPQQDPLPALLDAHEIRRVHISTGTMTLRAFRDLEELIQPRELLASELLDQTLRAMRQIKSPREIAALRRAQHITDQALQKALEALHPGVSELDVMMVLGQERARLGCETRSFDMMFSSGPYTALPHGDPSIRTIEDGDLVMIDVGSMVEGYTSDMTRTVAVGSPGPEKREVYEIVAQAQQAALEKLKPGAVCREVDAAARAVIAATPYAEACFGHGLGHSLGLEIHESPRLSPWDTTVLQPGMVVTVEPGIYIPGRFGVRIEDMVVITEDGYEDLTHSPKDWTVLQ